MENELLKISKDCLQNIININNTLTLIETRGDSTELIYKIRLLLNETLQHIQQDNQATGEQPIAIDNTKSENEGGYK